MSGRRCAYCGASPAPVGHRMPGLLAEMPVDLRGKAIWTCEAAECRRKAEQRVDEVARERGLK